MLDKFEVMVALIYFSSVYLALRVAGLYCSWYHCFIKHYFSQFYMIYLLYDSESSAFLIPFELLSDLSLD